MILQSNHLKADHREATDKAEKTKFEHRENNQRSNSFCYLPIAEKKKV
jgi:hypothetical protein